MTFSGRLVKGSSPKSLSNAIASSSRSPIPTSPALLLQARHKSSARYPGHIPLSPPEKAVLTVGSALAAFFNPRRADMIAALSETTSPIALPRLRDQMYSSEEGRAILRDRPSVRTDTINLPYLEGLEEGTFGRTYCDWLERCATSPDTRLPVKHVDDPELAFVLQRYRECHDFYHTITGLPVTLLPELALKWFEFANFGLPMNFLSGLSGLNPTNTLTFEQRKLLYTEYMPWGLRAGRNAKPLIGVYWERRWEQPVDELRQELGIELSGIPVKWRRGTLKERAEKRRLKELAESEASDVEGNA